MFGVTMNSCEISKEREIAEGKILNDLSPVVDKLTRYGFNTDIKFKYIKESRFLGGKQRKNIFVCEFSIFPNDLTKTQAKKQYELKILSLFIYNKEKIRNGLYKIKYRRDLFFKIVISFYLKKLKNDKTRKSFKDDMFDFLIRVFYPTRTGELSYMFYGKDFEWFRITFFVLLGLLVAVVTGMKEASLWESMGWI